MRQFAGLLAAGMAVVVLGCKGDQIDPDFPGQTPPPGTVNAALALRLGGVNTDQVVDIAADPDGSVYVTGTFAGSVDFDPGSAVSTLTSIGLGDIFLAKYTAAGALVWAERIGGTGSDSVTSLARDASGNLILGGTFDGAADMDPGPGNVFLTSIGGTDGFIAKYTSAGNLVWARRYGSTSADYLADVAVDGAGNVYAAGWFSSQADATPVSGGVLVSDGNSVDGFLLALDPAGAVRFAYAQGGPAADVSSAVTITSGGSVVVAGTFHSAANFFSANSTPQLTSAGGGDAFVAAYTSTGGLRWVRPFAGTGEEDVQIGGLAHDAGDNVVVTGTFTGTTDFGASTLRTSLGVSDWYLATLNSAGTLQTVINAGSTLSDTAPHISVDAGGNVLVTGGFRGPTDFDPSAGTRILVSLATAGSDVFAARYSAAGVLQWVSSMGEATAAPDRVSAGSAIVAAPDGSVLVGGRFFGSPNFGVGTNTFALTSLGDADGFLIRLTSTGNLATNP